MSAKVVPLRQSRLEWVPSLEELVRLTRAHAAKENLNPSVHFDHPHFQQRMALRGLVMRLVLETIREGEPVGLPKLDPYGDWRIKLKRVVAGRRVQVVVAVKRDHVVLVTAI